MFCERSYSVAGVTVFVVSQSVRGVRAVLPSKAVEEAAKNRRLPRSDRGYHPLVDPKTGKARMSMLTHTHVLRSITGRKQSTCIVCGGRTGLVCVGCQVSGPSTGAYCQSACFWVVHHVCLALRGFNEQHAGLAVGEEFAERYFPFRKKDAEEEAERKKARLEKGRKDAKERRARIAAAKKVSLVRRC